MSYSTKGTNGAFHWSAPVSLSRKQKHRHSAKDARGCHSSLASEKVVMLDEFRVATKEFQLDYVTSDEFLLPFLCCRKWDKKRALKLLRNYWELRKSHPCLFKAELDLLKPVLDQKLSTLLRLPDGTFMLVFNVGPWNPNLCSLEQIHHFNLTLLRVAAMCKTTVEKGLTAIVDMENLSLSQVRHFTPYYANLIISLLQDSFPVRFRSIHIVHLPYVFSLIMSVIWPLLSSKMKERVRLHNSLASIKDCFDDHHLPTEYGGSYGNIDWTNAESILSKSTLVI